MKPNPDIICLQEVFTEELCSVVHHISHTLGYEVFFPEHSGPSLFGFGFHNPSGLCTLIRKHKVKCIDVIFEEYINKSGFDRFVKKGMFLLNLRIGSHTVQVINTHLQSDFTELSCFRIRYPHIRELQEKQLFHFTESCSFPLFVGDFNKSHFLYVDTFNDDIHCTFPQTGEQLDFLLVRLNESRITNKNIKYYDTVHASDHIPILFEMNILAED